MKTLPVIAAFSHAIRSTNNNLSFAFRATWPWMLALLPVNIVGNLYILANSFGNPGEVNPKVLIPTFIMAIAGMVAFASIAVSWHRYILRDEIPRGMQRLRLDGTVWRYVGNILLIALILVLGGAIAGGVIGGVVMGVVAATMGNAGLTVLLPGMIALVAVFIPIGYRLSVKLPAVALGRRDYGLPNAWTDTKGNFWRFLGLGLLYFIVALIVAVAAGLLGLGLGYIGGGIGLSISIAVQLAVNWVLTILGVTMLTSLYGFFVEGRQF